MRLTWFPILGALACSGDAAKDTDTGAADSDTATSVPSECQTDICAVYGAAVPTVASDVTYAAAADPEFSADFAGLVARGQADIDAFIASLTNFISDAYQCSSGTYTGPSMVDAHTDLDITQQEYDDFITLIAGVLADNGVPEADITDCFAPPLVDPAFAADFIGR